VQDAGETVMRPGDCAAFPAGVADGHHLRNDAAVAGSFLVVGSKARDEVAHYSDVDLVVRVSPEGAVFTRRDGGPL